MRLTLLTSTFALLFSLNSFAALPEELESGRVHFKEAEAAIAAAKESAAKANDSLRSCRNGMLQLQFSKSIERLEQVRKSLETGRRDAQAFRSELEATRQAIEASNHGEGRASYAQRLSAEYATPFDSRLVPLLKTYAVGIDAWSAVFSKYAAFCAEPKFTAQRGAEFVAATTAEIDTLSKNVSEFALAASTAKGSVAVAAAPVRVTKHAKHHAGRR